MRQERTPTGERRNYRTKLDPRRLVVPTPAALWLIACYRYRIVVFLATNSFYPFLLT